MRIVAFSNEKSLDKASQQSVGNLFEIDEDTIVTSNDIQDVPYTFAINE